MTVNGKDVEKKSISVLNCCPGSIFGEVVILSFVIQVTKSYWLCADVLLILRSTANGQIETTQIKLR